MYIKISTPRVSTGSIFKLVLIGTTVSLVLFGFVLGVLGALGVWGPGTVQWNGKTLYGMQAFVASPFIGLVASLISTLMSGSLVAFGLWLYSKFKPVVIWIEE